MKFTIYKNYHFTCYYNPTLSQGFSTDPLAEKYPGISPYTYTADNPVMLRAKTSNGIHSFIQLDKNQALNTWYELTGHGIQAVSGANDKENSHDAIRYENLIRRVMGIKKFRDGSHHNGGAFPNHQALPKYMFHF